jgi:hypothetical protein
MSRHVLAIMDRNAGDIKIEFDPNETTEVDKAMAEFDRLVKGEKRLAVKTNPDGTKSATRDFDKTAVETTIIPQVVGG